MRTLLFLAATLCAASLASGQDGPFGIAPTSGPVSADGHRATIDIPAPVHIRNVGGSDGAGLCVFTSIQLSAYWQNVRVLDGYREWMRKRPGGGWPAKVDQTFVQFAKEKGVGVPPYIQHTGGDAAFLELALKTGRLPAVTYDGHDDFYSGRIGHMVSLAHLDADRAAIIDNNRPGSWVWMTRSEFLARWRGSGGGWAVVLLDAPPPPHSNEKSAKLCVCGDDCKCKAGECPNKCPTVFGGCGPGGCCPAPVAAGAGTATAAPGKLYRGSEPIDAPPSERYEWRAWDDGSGFGWRLKGEGKNYGVERQKIHTHPVYSINGREVTRNEAHDAMGDGLSDDSNRWHLTAVGDVTFLARVKADYNALDADLRSKIAFQSYAPDHWAVGLFKLPVGVSLRAPSTTRFAPELASATTSDYRAGRLQDILRCPGGPLPPVVPPPAPDKPNVKPTPAPAPQPNSEGDPFALLLASVLLYFNLRKGS